MPRGSAEPNCQTPWPLLVPPAVRGRQGRRESLRKDASRHRGGQLSRCFEVRWFGLAQHAHRLGGSLPAQRAVTLSTERIAPVLSSLPCTTNPKRHCCIERMRERLTANLAD